MTPTRHENVGYGHIDLPDQEMHTTAVWWQLNPAALDAAFDSRQQALDGFLGAGVMRCTLSPPCACQDCWHTMSLESRLARLQSQAGAGTPAATGTASLSSLRARIAQLEAGGRTTG
jgi:hypothetical protein